MSLRMIESAMRVIDLINVATEHLKAKGFDNSRLEVERLLGSVLGLSRIDLYMEFERLLAGNELVQFRLLCKRRLAHEPLQHILGSAGFREIEIKTDRRVFIPRPETEILVQTAVEFLKTRDEPLAADLGTGSGAIAISVAYEVPEAHIIAVDISDDALMITAQNARKMGVEKCVTLVSGDMLDGLKSRGLFDAILSNPPYVKTHDIEQLQPEIRDFEPVTALDGGADGFKYLDSIAADAHMFLKPGGLLLLECEGEQAEKVKDKLETVSCYREIEIILDLAGKKRIVKALLERKLNN